MIQRLSAAVLASLLLAAIPADAPVEVCANRTGMHDGLFFTFWKDAGDACLRLGSGGRYAARYRLGARQNLVTGTGWRRGTADRTVRYVAHRFEAGSNSYLALYGWSTDPLVEYYVVDDWGSDFTPPGAQAQRLGTVDSDGGTYTIYRTLRVQQPSIRGTATFPQFWSVRTARRTGDGPRTITFANHIAAWRKAGLTLGRMDYQVLATEGFGSTGSSEISVSRD